LSPAEGPPPTPLGGDPEGVRARLGLGDGPLLDFAASLNPLGPPSMALAAARAALDRVDRYSPPGSPRLVERLAADHGLPTDRVIVGAGTTELIGLIAQSLRDVLALHARETGEPSRPVAHLVEPTHGEYRRASVLNGLRTQAWKDHVLGWAQGDFPRSAVGLFWTGHPDNPTGRAWDRDRLLPLVDGSRGLLTVVDESFLPFLPDEPDRTLAGAVATRDNLLVLRSLTKVYALAGLRVGYALASPELIARLRQYQNPQAVSAPAEAAALAALDDPGYLNQTRSLIAAEAVRVTGLLWDLPGLRPAWPDRDRPPTAPPMPNYVLTSVTAPHLTSAQVRDALARRGFLVRECSDFPGLEPGSLLTGPDRLVATRGHLRIALRQPEENDRLIAALAEVLRI